MEMHYTPSVKGAAKSRPWAAGGSTFYVFYKNILLNR